jgi:hypothetical protein
MTLREQRCLFTRLTARLIDYANSLGYEVSYEETMRSKLQAQANAAAGTGISTSLHTIGLAVDLNLYILVNGVWQWQQKSEAHQPLGNYWKSLHPLARWGGDFKDAAGRPKPDGNHYSLEWQGRK